MLGLGANPAPLEKEPEPVKISTKIEPPPPRESNLAVEKGNFVAITAGRHKGLKGYVVEIKERDSGIVVKVELADKQVVRVWHDEVVLADKEAWVRPHIRVRVISKSFEKGKYYNKKGIVQDVSAKGVCVVKFENGRVFDGYRANVDMKQRYLETYIPRSGKLVMVLVHSDKSLVGQLAKLMERNDERNEALVQYEMSLDFEVIVVHVDVGV